MLLKLLFISAFAVVLSLSAHIDVNHSKDSDVELIAQNEDNKESVLPFLGAIGGPVQFPFLKKIEAVADSLNPLKYHGHDDRSDGNGEDSDKANNSMKKNNDVNGGPCDGQCFFNPVICQAACGSCNRCLGSFCCVN